MYLEIEKKQADSIAIIEESGKCLTYGELCEFILDFSKIIVNRSLIFILSENGISTVVSYVASISNKIVPLLLSRNIDNDSLQFLIKIYSPEYIWLPEDMAGRLPYKEIYNHFDSTLLYTGLTHPVLNENLSLLLTTSGTTGSPKLVRHSYINLDASAKSVATFFKLQKTDRPLAVLPLHYTMGLSVLSSHLYAGATVLLSKSSLTDSKFWSFVKEQKASSFTGVPYSYEVLNKLRFFRMDLPDLNLLTQGGGKLRYDLFQSFAEFAKKSGRRFIATYGQTEGTARMAYLPEEYATSKTCSIGRAIPGGQLSLIDDSGKEIMSTEATGQMVYRGPNVTLGYANCTEDLVLGDENNGVLFTGDVAKRDSEGFYYIVGRNSRFLKLYGLRVNMDEIESMVKSKFEADCICIGNDERMKVLITKEGYENQVQDFLVDKTNLFHGAIEVEYVQSIPKNESGKPVLI